MSAAFVPGRIRLVEPSSGIAASPSWPEETLPIVGLFGPIWTSVKGGGDGSRGEEEGETPLLWGLGVVAVIPEEKKSDFGYYICT
jgi:hypothetical protein